MDIDPLSAPTVTELVSKEILNHFKMRLNQEQNKRVCAEKTAKTAIKDAKEFERLKAQQRQRKSKAKKKQRAAESKRGKGRRGKNVN